MKIATWNVNSIKVRLEQVLAWLEEHQPDLLGLQETKVVDDKFPADAFKAVGYESSFTGEKTYNGVALLSRNTVRDVHTFEDGILGEQRRIIAGTIDDVRVINLYVVNGKSVGTDAYEFKLAWLKEVRSWIESELDQYPKTVVLGDFNITPDDRDVHDPELWREKILCSTPERDALGALLETGFADTFRLFDQPPATFSWWDYRQGAYRRKMGLRIDLVLASHELRKVCTGSFIDEQPRRNERPSDHAPAVATFS